MTQHTNLYNNEPPNPILQDISSLIKRMRADLEFSRAEAAEVFGISLAEFVALENCDPDISFRLLMKILERLEFHIIISIYSDTSDKADVLEGIRKQLYDDTDA